MQHAVTTLHDSSTEADSPNTTITLINKMVTHYSNYSCSYAMTKKLCLKNYQFKIEVGLAKGTEIN